MYSKLTHLSIYTTGHAVYMIQATTMQHDCALAGFLIACVIAGTSQTQLCLSP